MLPKFKSHSLILCTEDNADEYDQACPVVLLKSVKAGLVVAVAYCPLVVGKKDGDSSNGKGVDEVELK